MAKLPAPNLPPGNLYVLIKELHDLHARAGWPSTREIAKGQRFSHATVHALFTKTVVGAPRLPVLLDIVEVLAKMSGRGNVENTLDKFDRLWRAAYESPFSNDAEVDAASNSVDLTDREMIQVSFVHPTDSSQVLVATVAMDMPVAIIIERLIEAGFLNSQAWRGSYLLIDTGSGKMLRENDTFRTAKVSQRATINISHAATGG